MAEFGSAAWIEELRARLERRVDPPDPTIQAFVIEHRITDGPRWHVVNGPDGTTVASGPHPAPDVTVTTSAATAEAIRTGTVSAQRAFLDGELRLGGDIDALLASRDLLATIRTPRRSG